MENQNVYIENNSILSAQNDEKVDKKAKLREQQRQANKRYYQKTKDQQIKRALEHYYNKNNKYEYIIINFDKNDIEKSRNNFNNAFNEILNKTNKNIKIKLNYI